MGIPEASEIVFVSDMFVEDYVGGAELTSEALIKSSPLEVLKLHSRDVTTELLEEGHQLFWIFGNFSQMDLNLIPTITANMNYAVLEYDYKYCRFRSPEKHVAEESTPCDCQNHTHGKLISAFYYGAKSLWWMSEKQFERYAQMFPFLREKENCVLSSVFDDETFASIKILRNQIRDHERDGPWIVLGSSSWIKGADDAEEWCKREGKEYEVVWDLPHEEILHKLSRAQGHVYLPKGGDTCPRLTIEAKLLGCPLYLNDNVQHKDEEWFDTDDIELTESYLYASRARFWNGIKHDMKWNPRLSGYTTTRNCISQDYPYEATIRSLLGFCDEVIVADGGSTDGTWEMLVALVTEMNGVSFNELSEDERTSTIELSRQGAISKTKDGTLRIKQFNLDYGQKRFALNDGKLKALAREMCTGNFCWQMDSDEVVHENDYKRIRSIMHDFPSGAPMLALPVIEYWGGEDKVRTDILPWKWRISKNLPNITHGLPKEHRRYDDDGKLYSAGSDGCDLIDAQTHEPIPFMTFYSDDVEMMRRRIGMSRGARDAYEQWYNQITVQLPPVYHFSWWNIERKIKTYDARSGYWQRHWESLFNKSTEDTAESNMFFDKPWSEVTDEEISELAQKLALEMGGWIFHRKIDFTKPTSHVTLTEAMLPELVKEWCKRNKREKE